MQLAWNRLAETSRRLNLNSNSLLTRRNEYRPNRNYRQRRPPLDRISKNFGNKYLEVKYFERKSYAKTTIFNWIEGVWYFGKGGGGEGGGTGLLFSRFSTSYSHDDYETHKFCVCGKRAIWKSRWPVTRKASLYPTDKCDDCLTPRKVPKARAISKNNRSIGLFFLFSSATGNHEIKGTRPSRLYLPFMERNKGRGISRIRIL